MKVNAVAYSTKGIREHNEDSFLLNTEIGGVGIEDTMANVSIEDENCFFAVADGMGGHAAGDVASQFVVSEVSKAFIQNNTLDGEVITSLLNNIHSGLLEKGKAEETPNMGSTFVGLYISSSSCGFCNVGDSRLYRYRHGFIQQLSHDDSLSSLLPDAPKNIVTNAMGAGLPAIEVQTRFSESLVVKGDYFIICSDGVHGYISEEVAEEILAKPFSLIEKARQIVETALENGSDDNSTVVLVQVE